MSDMISPSKITKKTTHLYETSLNYVFEHFARFYNPPPGRHNVGQAEWIVDRERGLVVFKLYTEPDDAPPEGSDNDTIQAKDKA